MPAQEEESQSDGSLFLPKAQTPRGFSTYQTATYYSTKVFLQVKLWLEKTHFTVTEWSLHLYQRSVVM